MALPRPAPADPQGDDDGKLGGLGAQAPWRKTRLALLR